MAGAPNEVLKSDQGGFRLSPHGQGLRNRLGAITPSGHSPPSLELLLDDSGSNTIASELKAVPPTGAAN